MNVFFDIETIPCQSVAFANEIAASIKPPATYKKQESIDEWMQENKQYATDEVIAKTSFDGALGEICCIGWAINDGGVQAVTGNERFIIETFFNALESNYNPSSMIPPKFIGHNVSAFDLRFLFQRAIILGIKPPRFIPFNSKSWDEKIFDTMTFFAGFGNRISLDKLAHALGMEGKGGVTGADVWPLYKAGKIDVIAHYCENDVSITRKVYKRLTFA